MKRLVSFALLLCLFVVPLFGCYYEEEPVTIDPSAIYEGAERFCIGDTGVATLDDYVLIYDREFYQLLSEMYAYGFMDGYNDGEAGFYDDWTDYYLNLYDYDALHDALAGFEG